MLFDPVAFLIARRRGKENNLSSGEILKATLLGSAAGGGNMAVGAFIADRSIKQKAAAHAPVIEEPADCMESLINAFETFLSCMEKDKGNAEKLKEYQKAFCEFSKLLVTNAQRKKAIEKRLSELFTESAASKSSAAKETT